VLLGVENGGSMGTLIQDLRYGLRMLRKSPGFAVVAILTLTLGIGANTAIFSLLDGLVLRDLSVPHPEQLVRFGVHEPGDPDTGLSLPMLREFSRDQQVFSGTFAWWGDAVFNVETNSEISRGDIWAVTGDFYSELGATPEIGRLIEPSDVNLDAAAAAQVAVLGYHFWQRRYGGARNVIGKIIKIENLPFTIIGVSRDGFDGMSAATEPYVIVPLTAEPLINGDSDIQKHLQRPDALWLEGAGRLKPGVTLGQAQAQLDSLWPAIRNSLMPTQQTPTQRAYFQALQMKVESGAAGSSFVRGQFRSPVYILLAISGMVLLIACVNLASLMLSRAAARKHEFAVRLALGASRSRLTRQMLVESLMLPVAGTGAGFLLAIWGSRALAAFILGQTYIIPAQLNLSPDWRVLGFTGVVAILTGILFGLAPAWRASREDPNAALQQSSRTIGRGTARLGKALVVSQVALSLVLLASAGLFIRTLEKLHSVQPGFRTSGIFAAGLNPKPGGYKNLDWASYYHRVSDRVSNLPGVISAALTHSGLGEGGPWTEQIQIQSANAAGARVEIAMVMPGFFRTVGIDLLRGRTFTWQDNDRSPHVAAVSESFADKFFPTGNVIGQRINITTHPKWQTLQIVGIVSDATIYDIREHRPPTIYLPTTQYGDWMSYSELLVRTNLGPAALATEIRQAVEPLGHEYVTSVKTVAEHIDRALLQERVTAMLSAFFGALALLIAGIGLFGLMAYSVTQRTRELGIRVALGAQRGAVLRMILRETLVLALVGVSVGLPCALVATRFIAHMLFGVTPYDPVTLAVVAVALLAVGALAGCIPAHRAMRVDPMVALRYE
jgi:predicted permease